MERMSLTIEDEEGRKRPGPLTGGYFWFPTQAGDKIAWSVLTCHDLGFGPGDGHFEMWPALVDHLARTWGREPGLLLDRLENCWYGLLRGRINRTDGRLVLLHGDDAPVANGLERVVERFRLDGRPVEFQISEHHETVPKHRRAVNDEFGLSIGRPRTEDGEGRC